VQPGDGIIVGNVYGCTDSLMRFLQKRFGIDVYFVDATNPENVRDTLNAHPHVCAVLIETPDNPTLQLCGEYILRRWIDINNIPVVSSIWHNLYR
jgi:methionine-gamma-lyase